MEHEHRYDITVRRDGRWWLIYVPELDIPAQARSLADVGQVAREVIALWLDLEPEVITVSVKVELPEAVSALLSAAEEHDQQARAVASRAASERRAAVRTMTEAGITQADVARALGLSRQRISQLVQV